MASLEHWGNTRVGTTLKLEWSLERLLLVGETMTWLFIVAQKQLKKTPKQHDCSYMCTFLLDYHFIIEREFLLTLGRFFHTSLFFILSRQGQSFLLKMWLHQGGGKSALDLRALFSSVNNYVDYPSNLLLLVSDSLLACSRLTCLHWRSKPIAWVLIFVSLMSVKTFSCRAL